MTLSRIGKYEIVARIGRGAMGEVHKAHDPVLARFVAIKTISSLLDADEPQRERFLREARSAAQLNHPNIITIFDFGEEQGVAFIVMELLEGTDLKDIIDGRALNRIEDKLAVMEQIADGLAFAHAKGMVHRDLKPGNIHVLPNGQVKIMDFGLARRAADGGRTEDIIGTPNYMSPEQVKGERAGPRSDVFSIGGVFYEVIAGRKPFGADTIPAVLFNVVHKEAEPLEKWIPDLPVLARVVEKCLAKDPASRFADAAEMREALRAVRQALGGDLSAGAALAASLASDTVHIAAKPRAVPRPLSEAEDTDPAVKEALQELGQYLADQLPPLMVAESVGRLLGCPPEGVAADVHAWATRQTRGQATVPLAGLLLHAMGKIHQMGELKLIERDVLGAYLEKVGDALAGFCPPVDEEPLRRGIELLLRSGTVEPAPEPPVPPPLAEAGRRVKLLLDRLRQDAGTKVDPANESRAQLVAQALAAVVFAAGSGRELDQQLDYLRHFGVESGIAQVFRSLGQALSDWIVPSGAAAAGGPPVEVGGGREVEAMRRVITLAEEPVEAAKRFRDLVYAAIEQFNQGNLGRAVKMIELAEKVVEEKQIEAPYVETVRRKGHESLDQGRVRSFAESPDRHPALRRILNFFFFGLGVPALLDELQVEERRDRRRLLLTLLQAHGPAARETALKRVLAFVLGRDDPGPFLLRNLLSLLRLVPREAFESPEEEIEAVGRLAEPDRAAIVIREAILYLSVTRHPKARQVLIKLVRDYEGRLAHPELEQETREEWQGALDKIAAGLARQGGPAAWEVVVEHGLGGAPGMGDTFGRLTALSSQDLSASPPLVERLLNHLQSVLPRSVLGFKVSKKDHELLCLVEALSGTTAPAVRALLAEIAERFSNDGFGRAAAHALETTAGTRTATDLPVASHTGEIEAFGLPSLLHRLQAGEAIGRLALQEREGRAFGAMTLSGGRVLACEAGALRGPEAMYALLERPRPATFSFEARAVEAEASEPPAPLDVPALTVEGMRRYAELQRANALVPDDAALEATGASPTAVPDEQDYDLVVILWQKVCAGVTARHCEADLPVDPYRIRRALAHWFEEGALRRRTAEAVADAAGEAPAEAPGEATPHAGDAVPLAGEPRQEEGRE